MIVRPFENCHTSLTIKTEKSKLNFGKHYGRTVGWILSKCPKYLIWVYYHCSKISFADDILIKLNIINEFRIAKPGKSTVLYDKLCVGLSTMQEKPVITNTRRHANNLKIYNKVNHLEKVYSNKEFLRSRNQNN